MARPRKGPPVQRRGASGSGSSNAGAPSEVMPSSAKVESAESGERVVGPELDRTPVDAAVRALFGLSWGRARELIGRGKVTVGGRVVTSPTVHVYAGAVLAINLAAPNPRLAREALARDAFVFVDAHVVVVEKPPGISTVPFDPEGMGASIALRARPGEETTLDHRVRVALAKREKARGRGGPPPDIGVVHRLDKETSGLLVFTRSWAAKKALSQEFRAHSVHRRYLALVHGIPKDGTIVTHFIDDRGDGLRGSVEHRRGRSHAVGSERTQRAVTHIEVVERFATGGGAGHPAALVACRLETGRTHQIRIHLSEAGHPVLGERVYIRNYGGSLIPAPRVMLHAAELGFVHPGTGNEMRWTSKLPADMEEMRAFLRGTATHAPSVSPEAAADPREDVDGDVEEDADEDEGT